jgi:class 3 adenylate cyclase
MDEKHIDELVAKQKQKLNELREIGQEITSSATPIVVAFVDLAKSTQMKHDTVPEEWLGYIFDFTKRVGQKAKEADGSMIKRIGDELMVTFKEGLAAERFVD